MRGFCEGCLIACGMVRDEASIVADSLVRSNLRGVDSHGVVRMGIYVKRLKMGLVNPRPNVSVVSESDATLLVDGDNGPGQVVGVRAIEMGLDKAALSGTASVGVRRSNHYGAGAYYVERAVARGMAAFAYSNAPSTMAPWGGSDPYIGTNPYTFGVPAGRHQPIILDMATSVVARGKIILAAGRDEPIPEGWAVDREGRPTTDAQEALDGSVLPFGGPKGSAISLMIDLMAGVLTGAGFGPRVGSLYDDFEAPQDVGAYFQLTDIGSFVPLEAFKDRVDLLIDEIKSVRPAPGVEEVLVPGEIEDRNERRRLETGIPLGAETLDELDEAGRACGVDLGAFLGEVRG